jgi:hypothetical protein
MARAWARGAGAGLGTIRRAMLSAWSSVEVRTSGPFEIGRGGYVANSNLGNENLGPETFDRSRREVPLRTAESSSETGPWRGKLRKCRAMLRPSKSCRDVWTSWWRNRPRCPTFHRPVYRPDRERRDSSDDAVARPVTAMDIYVEAPDPREITGCSLRFPSSTTRTIPSHWESFRYLQNTSVVILTLVSLGRLCRGFCGLSRSRRMAWDLHCGCPDSG